MGTSLPYSVTVPNYCISSYFFPWYICRIFCKSMITDHSNIKRLAYPYNWDTYVSNETIIKSSLANEAWKEPSHINLLPWPLTPKNIITNWTGGGRRVIHNDLRRFNDRALHLGWSVIILVWTCILDVKWHSGISCYVSWHVLKSCRNLKSL